jgi:anaphase-promoting complex subunit 8
LNTEQKVVEELKELFPSSLFLKSQQALIAYHVRDFDTAETIFDSIYETDTYRVEDVDTYSNILYVMDKRAKLTSLAQHYAGGIESAGGDRMRPEVCCLLGNYWSLSGEHEKAIIEFKRALRLDPGYLSAWTLMGHEYVEMKNTYAAIESYRRAIGMSSCLFIFAFYYPIDELQGSPYVIILHSLVDANSKDYRAWYGLGQTYEVLDMLSYSLYYYQQATALKPYDTRMWLALAQVYEKLGRRREARMTTKRALMNAQPHAGFGGQEDFAVLLKLAELYDADGIVAEAAKYHKKFVDESLEMEGGPTVVLAKSLLYLAKYEIVSLPNFLCISGAVSCLGVPS